MSTSTLIRWSAPAFALGGICLAIFLFVANGEFTGAELGVSTRHRVAHLAHFFSALFFLFGIAGFYAAHRAVSGVFGFIAFVVAIVGTALFCATGFITGFVWRTISIHAPQLVEMDGAFFNPPLLVIFVAIAGFALGAVLLGVTAIRARLLPRTAALLYIAGAVLVPLPPPPWGPLPYAVIDVGAGLFAVGAVWLAVGLWRMERSTPVVASAIASPLVS